MRFDALNNQQNIPCKISNREWSMGPFHSESGKGFHEKSDKKDTGEGGTVIKVMLLKVQFFESDVLFE